jgi:hypothetical protein
MKTAAGARAETSSFGSATAGLKTLPGPFNLGQTWKLWYRYTSPLLMYCTLQRSRPQDTEFKGNLSLQAEDFTPTDE